MEVILLERIEKLGQLGEVVNVKPGFARNFLLPQGKALRATKENLGRFEGERVQLEAVNLERRGEAEGAAEKVAGFTCILLRQASDGAQLYGSVSARDIADAATESGVTITRQQVQLDRPIKTLGIHPIRVVLHPDVIVGIKVNVARTAEEAETQALALKRPDSPAGADAAGEASEEPEAPSVEEIFEQPETIDLEEGEADEDTANVAAADADADSGESGETAGEGEAAPAESSDQAPGEETPKDS